MDNLQHNLLQQCSGFDYVRFVFMDIHGIAKCKSVPAKHLKKYINEGINTCLHTVSSGPSSEIWDIDETYNVQALPRVFYPLPWASTDMYKVGMFICETFSSVKDNIPQSGSTRSLARRQLQRLEDLGYTLWSAFEMEFYLLKKDSREALFNGKNQYQTALRLSQFEPMLYEIESLASKAGIHIETIEEEGAPGQFEFAMQPAPGIEAIDQAFLLKMLVKEVALKYDYHATFMTKPLFKKNANGLHYNFSLRDRDGNFILHDKDDPHKLSQTAKYFIAGCMNFGQSLCALCSPTVNCYRRLHEPWTPDLVNWGLDDRLTLLRVKTSSPERTYFENRLPGGSANPYIVLAATVAAGVDGIINKLHCPPPVTKQDVAEKLPDTLQDALTLLQNDASFTEGLGQEFVDTFCHTKNKYEVSQMSNIDVKQDIDDQLELERSIYMETL